MACIYALRGDQDACLKALQTAREFGSLPDEKIFCRTGHGGSGRQPVVQRFSGRTAQTAGSR
ncbi:hypothetical protein [Methylomonas koyamae]|uniref:hypothetical protein n=1 Tax=Methylomonas koyamae TaxID=702114 RepID=UPI00402B0DEC